MTTKHTVAIYDEAGDVTEKQFRSLTADAERFNAPRHWGKALEESEGNAGAEIEPLNKPKLRQVSKRKTRP